MTVDVQYPNPYSLIPQHPHRFPQCFPNRLVNEQISLAVHMRGRTVDDDQSAPIILHKARRRVHGQGRAANDQQIAGGNGVQRILNGIGGQRFFI